MNIWVDITNAPHVIFFKKFIEQWKNQGHNVIVTARELSGSIELLKINDISFIEIGNHYGARKIQKLKGLAIRCLQLRRFLANKSIDVAVSQSSFYSPLVAKMLGVRCIYTNDNEFAKGNVIANIFATKILYPECMQPVIAKSFFYKKFCYYPGTKEGIYLSNLELPKQTPSDKYRIGIRPEPWTAQYHQRDDAPLVGMLKHLNETSSLTILPRDKKQAEFFKSLNLSQLKVLNTPLSLIEIYQNFDLFIGAGGSMSRELAFLGLPCLSMYQGELLRVDNYLIDRGVMLHNKAPTASYISELLIKFSTPTENLARELKNQGEIARQMLNKLVIFEAVD
ncbi:MAG: DUF354 domain-containing protein [Flavobacteriaceae bacterium]|nr:DUF354 domain-containing protein [Flavobacteriaceae bacterium]